jgi:uncharacterized protein
MRKALAPALLLTLAGCTRLFFFPDGRVYDRPERLGLAYDTPTFASLDGTPVTGIFFAARRKPAAGTVVHFHGNGGNITGQWGFSAWLADYGFNVFVLDYRGFGASEGKPSVPGAVKDGVAALRYVAARRDVDPSKLYVLGQSLGAGIALASIAESTVPVRAIALDSPLSSYRSIARDKLSRFWLTWPLQWPISLLVSDRHKPARMAKKLPRIPVIVVHGTADTLVPYSEGVKLYEALPPPKELWTIANGGHVEAFTRFGEQYRPALVEFFKAAP